MELVPQDIREQLMENGRAQQPVKGTEDERDYYPVVKLFNPVGAATWLITEMDPDEPDILFGLCRAQHKPNYDKHMIMLRGRSDPRLSARRGSDRFT
jgi:hypothetical protein